MNVVRSGHVVSIAWMLGYAVDRRDVAQDALGLAGGESITSSVEQTATKDAERQR